MVNKDYAAFVAVGGRLPETTPPHESLMLAGNVMALPLANLRASQATLEATRTRIRGAETRYAARALEARGALRLTAIVEAETARLGLEPPETGKGMVSVYGFAAEDGNPVTRGEAALIEGEQTFASVALCDNGSFALTAKSERPLALKISSGRSTYTDPMPLMAPGPIATYRIVNLEGASGCEDDPGRDDPKTGRAAPALDPATVADVSGTTLHHGLTALADKGVRVSTIRMTPGEEATPKIAAVRTDPLTNSVALDVSARDGDSAPMAVLATVLALDPTTDKIGMTGLGVTRDWLRDKQIGTLDEARAAAELPPKDLRARFGITAQSDGTALKRALTSALDTIDRGD